MHSLAGGMGCFRAGKTDEDDEMRKEANRKIEKQLQKDKQAYRATHRLLLLGNSVYLCYLYVVLPTVITQIPARAI